MEINEKIDNLIRDLTQVGSIPKSEARRRIMELIQTAANQEIAKYEKNFQEMAMNHAAIQGALDQEIALLKGKLEKMDNWVKSHSTHFVPYELKELQAILTPSPKEEKK